MTYKGKLFSLGFYFNAWHNFAIYYLQREGFNERYSLGQWYRINDLLKWRLWINNRISWSVSLLTLRILDYEWKRLCSVGRIYIVINARDKALFDWTTGYQWQMYVRVDRMNEIHLWTINLKRVIYPQIFLNAVLEQGFKTDILDSVPRCDCWGKITYIQIRILENSVRVSRISGKKDEIILLLHNFSDNSWASEC